MRIIFWAVFVSVVALSSATTGTLYLMTKAVASGAVCVDGASKVCDLFLFGLLSPKLPTQGHLEDIISLPASVLV